MPDFRLRAWLAPSCAALALTACGGGGGGGPTSMPAPPTAPSPAPTPPPPPEAPITQPTPPTPPAAITQNQGTSEYQRSNGVVQANALIAYNAGITGSGVTAGIIDSGIDAGSAEFAGRISPASLDLASRRGIQDEGGHGTAVSAILGAARNEAGVLGIAYGATLLVLRTDNVGTCVTEEGCKHGDIGIARAIDVAIQNRARVINISLGGDAGSPTFVAAVNRATAAGTIVVMSAGNDGNADPDGFALVANDPAVSRGLVIIAGSVGVDTDRRPDTIEDIDVTRLSLFSQRAGSSAASYLAAQGQAIVAPNIEAKDNALFLFSGTSFSAPVITGAVALLAQAFPNLTGRQIVDLLYRSANDLGDPGDDAVFGQGSLNIARAFRPQGATALAGSGVAVSMANNGTLPAASGDAKTGKAGAVILDMYDRAFAADLAGTLGSARTAEPLGRALGADMQSGHVEAGPLAMSLTTSRLRDRPVGIGLAQLGLSYQDSRQARLVAGMAIGRISDKTAIAMGFSQGAKALERRLAAIDEAPFMIARDPHAAPAFDLARGDALAVRRQVGRVGLTLSGERGRVEDERRLFGEKSGFDSATLTADGGIGPVRLSLSGSRMREDATVLGGRFDAALGAPGATSWFADTSADMAVAAGWRAAARYRRGWTGFGANGSGSLSTDAFAFDLAKAALFSPGDRLGLRFAQPLRVRSGGLGVLLPNGYSYATLATEYGLTRFNLAPEGRELDFEAAYSVPLAGGWLGANAFLRRQPGHIRVADDDIGGAFQFTLGF